MNRYTLLFMIALFLLLPVFYGRGLAIGATQLFAGKIVSVTPCTCSIKGTNLIYIPGLPPRGGVFTLYPPLTKSFSNMKPVPGSWAIGEYIPSGGGPTECYMEIGATCLPAISQGSIKRIATS